MEVQQVVRPDFIAWYQRVWTPIIGVPDLGFVTMAKYSNNGPTYLLLKNVSVARVAPTKGHQNRANAPLSPP